VAVKSQTPLKLPVKAYFSSTKRSLKNSQAMGVAVATQQTGAYPTPAPACLLTVALPVIACPCCRTSPLVWPFN